MMMNREHDGEWKGQLREGGGSEWLRDRREKRNEQTLLLCVQIGLALSSSEQSGHECRREQCSERWENRQVLHVIIHMCSRIV